MHGGKRTGSGRKAGSQNKTTAELREYASQYSKKAIDTLAAILDDESAPHSAKINAANSLLDRTHGKPVPIQDATEGDELTHLTVKLVKANEGNNAE